MTTARVMSPAGTPQSRSRSRDGYDHLEPLFVERRSLPDGHPRRQVIRDRLVTGYRPVALHIARRHAYRGGDLEDLEQVPQWG